MTQMLAPSLREIAARGRVPAYLRHARALISWPLQRWRGRPHADPAPAPPPGRFN
jgi:hypothetical protein